MKRLIPLFLFFLCTASFAQQQTVYVGDVIHDAANSTLNEFIVQDVIIRHRPRPQGMDGGVIGHFDIPRKLIFKNCRFPDWTVIDSVNVKELEFKDCQAAVGIALSDVDIKKLNFVGGTLEQVSILSYSRENIVSSKIGDLFVASAKINIFSAASSAFESIISFELFNFTQLDGCKIGTISMGAAFDAAGGLASLKATDCTFGRVILSGLMADFDVENTAFTDELFIRNLNVSGLFKIVNCNFDGFLTINKLAVPSENIQVAFDQVAGSRIRASMTRVRFVKQYGGSLEQVDYISKDSLIVTQLQNTYRYGSRDSAFFNSSLFEGLIYNYQRLFNSYKIRGDIESANACYVELKELERSRLKFRHAEHPSFKSFVRLQLSSLLKFYTEHGTDPAKAIEVSAYVIILFGVFYFFFPSDWDTQSKGRLLRNYRDFVEKNSKGYVKPLLYLLFGFILSFFNALTLSLNSFITLGFGNIPTHGLARYMCVVQGFIGWFLLSIFTVALINQVLF